MSYHKRSFLLDKRDEMITLFPRWLIILRSAEQLDIFLLLAAYCFYLLLAGGIMTSHVSPECLIDVSIWTLTALYRAGDAMKTVVAAWNTESINTSLPLCAGQTLQLCYSVDMDVRSIQVKAFFKKESNFRQSIWPAIRAEPPASGSEVLISVPSHLV